MTTGAERAESGSSEPPSVSDRGRGSLGALFVAVLLDLIGFGIILPLLPYYATDFGASAFQVGLLVTIYSGVHLVTAPLWGRASDRWGRKPILLLGLMGSTLAYLIFAQAGSLAVLFISRLVGGVGGSTVPVAQAYIADVTPPSKRAGNMGLIGAAFGLGFVIGPAVGGLLSTISYQAAGYAAAGLCLANTLLTALRLPESRGRRVQSDTTPRFDFFGALRQAAASRQIRILLGVYFFITMAFSALQPTLSLLAAGRFSMEAREAGYLFALLGMVSVVVQGGLVRRIVPRIGERRLLRLSTLPLCAGLALAGWGETVPLLVIALVLIGVGYGGCIPSALGLLSRTADPGRQGAVLGLGQSVGSSARVVGPSLAGGLFDIRIALAYGVAAGLALVALAGSAAIDQPAADTTGPA